MTNTPEPNPAPRQRLRIYPNQDLDVAVVVTPEATEDPSLASAPIRPETLKAEYSVGYKRPPKSGQFQPGKSGNPKGRPKLKKSLSTIVRDELDRKAKIKIGGKIVQLTLREALVKRWLDKALQGDPKALANLIKFDRQGPSENEDEALLASTPLTGLERALINEFLADKQASNGGAS